MKKSIEGQWLYEIKPKGKFIDLNFKEIWRYRDLLMLFVRRDIVAQYKQTVLGPFWYLIQPLLTSVTFTLIFNNVAGIETPGVPPFLFNLAGITIWTYFKQCLTMTSTTFTTNAGLFGKVYFPRFISPASKVISSLFKFGIQLFIFMLFFLYYLYSGNDIQFGNTWYLLPISILNFGLIGLGLGMIFSAFTTKYRDFKILISFGIGLLMYISAVMYPLEIVKEKLPNYYWLVEYNPLAQLIEGYRFMLLNTGKANTTELFINMGFALILLIIGLAIFNRTEKTFIDTV